MPLVRTKGSVQAVVLYARSFVLIAKIFQATLLTEVNDHLATIAVASFVTFVLHSTHYVSSAVI